MVEGLILMVMLGVCIAVLCVTLANKKKSTCCTSCHCENDIDVNITQEDILNDLTNKDED